MNELKVSTNVVMPVIDVNFDELMAAAEKMAKEYTSVAITADNYKEAKNSAKELAGYANDVDTARKEIKKKLETPIKEMEENFKKTKKVLDDAKQRILAQTEEFDAKRRKEKEDKANALISEMIGRYCLSPKFASQLTLKPEYLNLSATAKSVMQDLNDRAYELSKAQDEEQKIYQEAEATIKAVNDTLEQKLDMNDLEIRTFISYAISDSDKDANWLSGKIREKAAQRKSAEDAIKEKILKEQEAKKAKAAEVIKMPEKQGSDVIDIDDDIDDVDDAPVVVPTEPVWFMAVELTGPSSKLSMVGDKLKELCAELGVTYNVDKTRCKVIKGGKTDGISA